MTTIDRILLLRDEQNLTSKEVETGAGLANSSISQWKRGRGKPSLDNIVKLSQFFNVSADYLLGLSTQRSAIEYEISLSDEDSILLTAYHSAKTMDRFRIIQTCLNALDNSRESSHTL